MIRNDAGVHEVSHGDPASQAYGRKFLEAEFAKTNKVVASYAALQFWLYVLGSISFIAWHIYEMYLRRVTLSIPS